MRSLTIELACSGSRHRITVAADTMSRARLIFHDHDRRAERVLMALGGQPPACLAVPDQLAGLTRLERSPLERARWVAAGVTTGRGLAGWRQVGDPETARRWQALGVSGPGDVAHWATWDVDLECAEAWAAAGVPLDSHIGWWQQLGVFHPDEMDPWLDAGVSDGADARLWAFNGISRPEQVRAWRAAGILDGADFERWGLAARRPSAVAAWHQAGITCGSAALEWVRAGVHTPAGVFAWRAAGVHSGADRAGWATAGVARPDQLTAWHRLGITTGARAASWVEPRFVFGVDEVAAWQSAGVTNPQVARELVRTGGLPPGVAASRRHGGRRLTGHSAVPDGRPGAVVRRRDGTVTEVYFYAYGWTCRRDVATHWVAMEVLDGEEVPRSQRRGLLVNGDDEPWRKRPTVRRG